MKERMKFGDLSRADCLEELIVYVVNVTAKPHHHHWDCEVQGKSNSVDPGKRLTYNPFT